MTEQLKPCPFCGTDDTLRVEVYQCREPGWEQGWEPSITCQCGIDFGIGFFGGGCDPDDIEKNIITTWNTRYEEKDHLHRVMVVGDGHDRIPLIDAINQIGFDGIIIAEGPPPEPIEIKPIAFEIPERCSHTKMPKESNADRCGYSTKRK